MKITKATKIQFTDEDKKVASHFRHEILHPMCDIVNNDCSRCPIKHCTELEDLLCTIYDDGYLEIPIEEKS